MRWEASPIRVGQIVFDPMASNANENPQDLDAHANPNAIRNVWMCGPKSQRAKIAERRDHLRDHTSRDMTRLETHAPQCLRRR